MKTFKLIIEYDGSFFYGWQRQPDRPTVQGEIETALSRMLNQQVSIHGAGRTDAGVHAFGQAASFTSGTKIPPHQIQKGLNSLIKKPVVIHSCTIVHGSFHARYSAVSKEYHYHILNRELPCALYRNYQWHVPCLLDIDVMNACCRVITGYHDFKSFENTGSPRSHTCRKITRARVITGSRDRVVIEISGSGFLKNMVRNLAGTMVMAGRNKISIPEFEAILAAKDRRKAGVTAPAHGLFLVKVVY